MLFSKIGYSTKWWRKWMTKMNKIKKKHREKWNDKTQPSLQRKKSRVMKYNHIIAFNYWWMNSKLTNVLYTPQYT